MGRLEKLKLENIKKANELLDKGHTDQYPNHEQVELKPSGNVRNSSASFLNKMNNLKEEEELGGMTSDPRIMAREYGGKYTKDAEAGAIYTKDVDTPEMSREYGERELTPAQQKTTGRGNEKNRTNICNMDVTR